MLAITCGVTLALGSLIKLLDVTAVVPVLLLASARLWRVRRQPASRAAAVVVPIAAGIAAGVITITIVLLPFRGSLHALLQQVVMFHIAARKAMAASGVDNVFVLYRFFTTNVILGAAAIAGAIVAIFRRDWRVVPLIGWALVTFIGLLMQVPLFGRHAIVLLPPLIALMALGLHDLPAAREMRQVLHERDPVRSGALLVGLLALAAVLAGIPSDYRHFRTIRTRAGSSETQRAARIAADLQQVTTPEQWIITDAQLVAGLADRDTPPWLVDTSFVRVRSGVSHNARVDQGGIGSTSSRRSVCDESPGARAGCRVPRLGGPALSPVPHIRAGDGAMDTVGLPRGHRTWLGVDFPFHRSPSASRGNPPPASRTGRLLAWADQGFGSDRDETVGARRSYSRRSLPAPPVRRARWQSGAPAPA